MSLIVEDGTGLANAESLCSVAFADTYHANMGNAAWAALSTTVKEQCLRKGAQYMLARWRARWKGYRVNSTQALDFPRWDIVDDNGYIVPSDAVPTPIATANAELALSASTEELLPNESTPGAITEYSVQVGPIKEAKQITGWGADSEGRRVSIAG
jgi:hypothetical protein